MLFEEENIYHIYNQGNNRQKIFYCRDNYLFFLKKIRKHILPFADILAWCLMPNHFHLMIYVKTVEISISDSAHTHGVTQSHSVSNQASQNFVKKQTLNDSIAILLRSYTRAINKQEDRSGALFREGTKAECLTNLSDVTPTFFNTSYGTLINRHLLEEEYPQICFDYIHNNPVKAGLSKRCEEWEFSSYLLFRLCREARWKIGQSKTCKEIRNPILVVQL